MCYPFTYHDIGAEIPAAHRATVRLAYTLWICARSALAFDVSDVSVCVSVCVCVFMCVHVRVRVLARICTGALGQSNDAAAGAATALCWNALAVLILYFIKNANSTDFNSFMSILWAVCYMRTCFSQQLRAVARSSPTRTSHARGAQFSGSRLRGLAGTASCTMGCARTHRGSSCASSLSLRCTWRSPRLLSSASRTRTLWVSRCSLTVRCLRVRVGVPLAADGATTDVVPRAASSSTWGTGSATIAGISTLLWAINMAAGLFMLKKASGRARTHEPRAGGHTARARTAYSTRTQTYTHAHRRTHTRTRGPTDFTGA